LELEQQLYGFPFSMRFIRNRIEKRIRSGTPHFPNQAKGNALTKAQAEDAERNNLYLFVLETAEPDHDGDK
jgi:hypothetical protein